MPEREPMRWIGLTKSPLRATEESGGNSYVGLASASLVVRLVTLPLTGAANLMSAHIVVTETGVSGYALFSLVVTLPQLLPVGDLGMGAAVMDACARRDSLGSEAVRRTMTTSARNLFLVGALVVALSIGLGVCGAWPALLGVQDAEANVAAAIAFAVFGLGLPFGLGGRALAALNLNHVALLVQAAASVAALVITALVARLHGPPVAYCVAGFIGIGLAGAASLAMAGRVLDLPLLKDVALSAWPGRPSARIWHFAGPMTVVVLASSVAYSCDRVILSHVAGPVSVAEYSAAAQLFGPLFGVVGMMGLALWGEYARRRGSGAAVTTADLKQVTAFFAIVGLALGAALVGFGPVVVSWLISDKLHVPTGLFVAFALLLLGHACNYPNAMLLTDPPGLRRQAVCCCAAAVVSTTLTFVLGREIGAAGPPLASFIALVGCIYLPGCRLVLSRLHEGGKPRLPVAPTP
jgi:O-antigen/teichoic acid export membrane protein